jgi:hypothetical protein
MPVLSASSSCPCITQRTPCTHMCGVPRQPARSVLSVHYAALAPAVSGLLGTSESDPRWRSQAVPFILSAVTLTMPVVSRRVAWSGQ